MSDALDFRGAALALLENALDELAGGHAREVELELGAETIRVRDDGRGLPVHAHPQSGRPLLEVILTGPRRGPRNTLARLNAGCLWLEVSVERAGERWRQRYELALPAGPPERVGAATGSGTTVTCAPSRGAPPALEELERAVRARAGLRGVVRLRAPTGDSELVLG